MCHRSHPCPRRDSRAGVLGNQRGGNARERCACSSGSINCAVRVRRARVSCASMVWSTCWAFSPAGEDGFRHFRPALFFQDQQDAFAAAQLGGFFDEEGLDGGGGVQGVEAQAGGGQPLEGLAHIGLDGEIGEELFLGQLAFCNKSRHPEPEVQQFAVGGDLVEIAAAQAFVAHVGDAFEQEIIRPFQGGTRRCPVVGWRARPACAATRFPARRRRWAWQRLGRGACPSPAVVALSAAAASLFARYARPSWVR